MQRRSSRSGLRLVVFSCSAALLAVTFLIPAGSAGWAPESRIQQVATTTPMAPDEPGAALSAAQESGDTGDVIQRRIYSTLVTAALLTLCSLLLLGTYVLFRDPLRRRWAEMHSREMRRRDRRSRHRKHE